jgi:magnesium-transporting ATPase (P-type)
MIYDDFVRQVLLGATCLTFVFFALWAILKPNSLANTLGYELNNNNAISEFNAIYIGVFMAQSLLCVLAFVRIDDAMIGNLVAVFLLSQPLGRIIAMFRGGSATGFMKLLFTSEVVAGLMLLVVQPSA